VYSGKFYKTHLETQTKVVLFAFFLGFLLGKNLILQGVYFLGNFFWLFPSYSIQFQFSGLGKGLVVLFIWRNTFEDWLPFGLTGFIPISNFSW